MKVIAALSVPAVDTVVSAGLRDRLRRLGVTRLQVNLDDEHVPDSVLRLQHFERPVTCVASLWCEETVGVDAAVEALRGAAEQVAAWEVEERVPLEPPAQPDGERADALAQVAFLRRPAELSYDAWLAHWHGPHTQVAMETQATFGYVQNRVLRALSPDTPHVDAVVEELFPAAAMHDIHAFYGSGGSQQELDRRLTRLMASVAVIGADRDLDVVPTSRYVWRLG